MPITQHWLNHIEAWQGSGLKKADYCRQHNINVKSFAARFSDYQRLREEENPVLIPVTVTQESVQPLPSSHRLVLTFRQDYRLELPETVSAQWLSALLRGLV